MIEHFPIEFIGAIIGGGISGGVGIFVAWYMNLQKEKNWIKENVYIPLYDSIMKLKLEPIFDGYTEHKWRDLESHKKLKADRKIKDLYEKYEKLGNQHHHLLVTWENEFQKKFSDLLSTIRGIFINVNLINHEGQIPITSSYPVEIKSFQDWFKHVLFDKTIKNQQELYEKLLEYSKKRSEYQDFGNWFIKTHNEKPDFYTKLFNELKQISHTFPASIDYDELVKKRNELKLIILEIRKELKNIV